MFLFVVVGALPLLSWVALHSPQPEPVYRGHPLNYWLHDMDQHDFFDRSSPGPNTDAVPVLSKAVEIRNNIFADTYRRLWPKTPAWIQSRWPCPVDAAKVRKIAASALGKLGDVDFRIKLLKSHPNLDVRLSAAASLCREQWDEKALQGLADVLTEKKDIPVKISIVENGYGYNGYAPYISVPALIAGLSDGNAEVRTNAAMLLITGFQEPACVATVSNVYRENPIERKADLERLSKALKSDNPAIHDAAAHWLWFIDGQRPNYKSD